ncbi:pectinesterase [Ranunculus cassubicifolius]
MSRINEFFAGISSSSKKKKLFFITVSTILVVGAIIGIVAGVSSHKNSDDDTSAAHSIIKTSCETTRYPELCMSELLGVSGIKDKVTSHKDVIQIALNQTILAVEHNYFQIKKITKTYKGLTKRERCALHDCLETIDETLDELHETKDELDDYPKKKTFVKYADDLKTLLSAAMTNQDTCIDGFSSEEADKKVRKLLIAGQQHVYHMVSNALAMICNLTSSDIAAERLSTSGRNLVEEEDVNAVDSEGFPKWLSGGDRRLLQARTVTPNAVVAADGSGNYRTVAAAVAAAPEGRTSSNRWVIRIKAGTYRENVEVTKKKTNLMFMGDGRRNTIITASRNVVDGSTTFNSATVIVVGAGFLARDITFQNTAGPQKHQAVALRVGADLSAFYQCDMLAYQDTLYVHSLRQFYINCLVAGSVDFIFGNAAVVLQDCDIHARRPMSGQRNMMTAQGRDDPNQNTGIVIQKCRLGATSDLLPVQSSFPTYLGRPWKEYSRTIVMQSSITNVINPAGWYMWDGNFALNTLFYAEYQNTGAGAGTANRVKWGGYRVLTSAAAVQGFTAARFLGGSSWLGSTGFPYSLGL